MAASSTLSPARRPQRRRNAAGDRDVGPGRDRDHAARQARDGPGGPGNDRSDDRGSHGRLLAREAAGPPRQAAHRLSQVSCSSSVCLGESHRYLCPRGTLTPVFVGISYRKLNRGDPGLCPGRCAIKRSIQDPHKIPTACCAEGRPHSFPTDETAHLDTPRHGCKNRVYYCLPANMQALRLMRAVSSRHDG